MGSRARWCTADDAYLTYGFAKHLRDALPNAGYIGFTGTPIAASDRTSLLDSLARSR